LIKYHTDKLSPSYTVIDYDYPTITLLHNDCGNIFTINNTTINNRLTTKSPVCTNCNPIQKTWSIEEKNIRDYISSMYSGLILENDRHIINPYELDIYLPDLKLAIEYNGSYWHSEDKVGKNYHKRKHQLCFDKGIRLIQIHDTDWMFKQDIVKSILKTIFGSNRIYARKCEVKKIDKKLAHTFIDSTHLQGFVIASHYYGLWYKGRLVQVMSFKKIKNGYEISRLCTELNTSVIGGANRLFKRFINDINPKYVLSYNNNDYFSGKVYEKLGFEFKGNTVGGYYYINGNLEILSRQQCQKHKLVSQGYDEKLTEVKIMESRGYYRIFNSGNGKYEYKKG
jgi:hypothetical protein